MSIESGGFARAIPAPAAESAEKASSFDEQWGQPERYDFGDDTIEIFDIRPEGEEHPIPVVLMPGWAGTPEMYRENARELVKKGRRVISVNAPHGISVSEGQLAFAEASNVPESCMRQISALVTSLELKGISEVSTMGHSQGSLISVLTASLFPEYFKQVQLINPAGMIGKDSFWRLATGFSADVVRGYADQIRRSLKESAVTSAGKKVTLEPMLRAMREVGGSMVKDPVRAFREVLAISDAEIHGMLDGLIEKGIGVTLIYGADDRAFPAERMEQVIPASLAKHAYKVAGDHSRFQTDAEAFTNLAENILRESEQEGRTEPLKEAA